MEIILAETCCHTCELIGSGCEELCDATNKDEELAINECIAAEYHKVCKEQPCDSYKPRRTEHDGFNNMAGSTK